MSYPSPFEEVRQFLEDRLPGYLDLLRRMISINSFTANPAGVNRLGDLTAEVFSSLGFTEERIQATNFLYGRHLVLTRAGRPQADGRPAPKIGLISHLDTVYPVSEEEANDFRWRVIDDRLYGPGAVDIKGGTVMIYMVLTALQRFFPEVYEATTWLVLLNAAEEVLAPDFGDLCRQLLGRDAPAALIFEGGDVEDNRYKLVTARKGMARYHIKVEGRSAHAGGFHQKGANAIVQMADVIREIAGFTDYERDLTFNVGSVLGGTVVNRVPHQAAASVEMRAFDPEVFDAGVARMLALNNYCTVRSVEDGYECRVDVELEGRWEPWPENEASLRLLSVWNAAAAELGMAAVAHQARGGLSDGNWLWDYTPTIDGLGPEGDNAHSSERSEDGAKDQEYVLASSFVPKATLNVAAIVKLLET